MLEIKAIDILTFVSPKTCDEKRAWNGRPEDLTRSN